MIFDLIETDKSGKLSIDEFIEVVRCFDTGVSDAEIEAAIKKADLDSDGEIDFQEFITTQSLSSDLKIAIGALRSFKKILVQYPKVAQISSRSNLDFWNSLASFIVFWNSSSRLAGLS